MNSHGVNSSQFLQCLNIVVLAFYPEITIGICSVVYKLLVYFPDGYTGQSWARPEPGALPVSLGGSCLDIRTIFCCLSQAVSKSLDWNWSTWDTSCHPYGMVA